VQAPQYQNKCPAKSDLNGQNANANPNQSQSSVATDSADLQNVTFDLDLITWQLFYSPPYFFVAKINGYELKRMKPKNQMTLGAIYARNYRRKGVQRDE